MLHPDTATEVVPYLTSAATIVHLQKWLKTRAPYQALVRALPGADKWTHWLVAAVASLVASLGIHVVWDWDVIKGGQAVFTIPGAWDLLHGTIDWWKVYILQATVYEATSHVLPTASAEDRAYVGPGPVTPPPVAGP